ncbi:hypothetical protein SAMN05216548_11465 [Faunimonas pinastri]|uniref:Uncharacterized protein n=1 Tax=Faunimonas pinastri TaxID=1855383 RepID=A0A1H9MV94_9HYPH|nr:hypothetical protein [Faunimonas pinastri]SER27602.1 hypothetical protein SAMN05216548_11465 [Faunimonas pinastri]
MTESKVWTAQDILDLLQRSDKAVARAIGQLCARGATFVDKADADFLTSVAQALPRYRDHMTPRQLARARRILPNYVQQLLGIMAEGGKAVDEGPISRNSEIADRTGEGGSSFQPAQDTRAAAWGIF